LNSKRGIVFLSAISECQSPNEYVAEVLKKSAEDLIGEKLSHVHDLARVCNTKFNVLKIGLWSAALGVAATVLLLVLCGLD
jgi:hypothetical protein